MENNNDILEKEVKNQPSAETTTFVSQDKIDRYMEQIRPDQNFPQAVLAGLAAALVGAAVWALITVSTEHQIGYMAVLVGFLVGFVVRVTGKGIDQKFGILGALLAVLGCLIGNLFSTLGFIAQAGGVSFFSVLSVIDLKLIPELMGETFNFIDLLFYGIAIYEGYKFSFRKVTEEEVAKNVF